ncbi:hypothetical protein Agub_g10602, partial [Astrephomene gubernaculifera]
TLQRQNHTRMLKQSLTVLQPRMMMPTVSKQLRTRINCLPFQLRSITLPRKPTEPGPEDCCQSGCNICVWDQYADALEKWKERVSKLEAKESGKSLGKTFMPPTPPKNVGLVAFEELEKQLSKQTDEKEAQPEQNQHPG